MTMQKEPDASRTTADEFWEDIWWVPDGTGHVRNATPGECAAEIKRLHLVIRTARDEIKYGDEAGAYLTLKHAGVE